MIIPENLEKYLKIVQKYGLINKIIDKLFEPENIKAIVSGAVEGVIKSKMKDNL